MNSHGKASHAKAPRTQGTARLMVDSGPGRSSTSCRPLSRPALACGHSLMYTSQVDAGTRAGERGLT